jgi:tripartite-type tricarboxylate transporter receptor subunit TctC
MVSGEVQLIFTTPPTVMPYIKGGKVKILGTSGRQRVSYLPDVPTLAEAGIKDFNTAPWQGLLAPAGTPKAIIDRLYRQIGEVLKTTYAQERFSAAGTDVVGSSPQEFSELIKRELEQNSKVIKAVGMRAD